MCLIPELPDNKQNDRKGIKMVTPTAIQTTGNGASVDESLQQRCKRQKAKGRVLAVKQRGGNPHLKLPKWELQLERVYKVKWSTRETQNSEIISRKGARLGLSQ